jgi:hypothetical protein
MGRIAECPHSRQLRRGAYRDRIGRGRHRNGIQPRGVVATGKWQCEAGKQERSEAEAIEHFGLLAYPNSSSYANHWRNHRLSSTFDYRPFNNPMPIPLKSPYTYGIKTVNKHFADCSRAFH